MMQLFNQHARLNQVPLATCGAQIWRLLQSNYRRISLSTRQMCISRDWTTIIEIIEIIAHCSPVVTAGTLGIVLYFNYYLVGDDTVIQKT